MCDKPKLYLAHLLSLSPKEGPLFPYLFLPIP
jgi:hypothetical protein